MRKIHYILLFFVTITLLLWFFYISPEQRNLDNKKIENKTNGLVNSAEIKQSLNNKDQSEPQAGKKESSLQVTNQKPEKPNPPLAPINNAEQTTVPPIKEMVLPNTSPSLANNPPEKSTAEEPPENKEENQAEKLLPGYIPAGHPPRDDSTPPMDNIKPVDPNHPPNESISPNGDYSSE